MNAVNRKWYSGMSTSEDWWAVWLGLIMFAAGLMTVFGVDMVGWMSKTKTWVDPGFKHWLKPTGKAYKDMAPFLSFVTTYVVWTVLTCIGAFFMKLDVKKFFMGWTIIFLLTWAMWIIGHEAHLKALKTSQSMTQSEIYGDNVYCTTKVHKCSKQINTALKEMGVDVDAGQVPTRAQAAQAVDKAKNAHRLSWGMQLGGGASFILALIVGLIIGNFFKGFAAFLKEAAKPEWYIKTAIVYLGIKIGLMSMKAAGFVFELAVAGMCATIVAYLLFWPITYALGRKVFKLSRAASAVLSSGISICGVSAAIATAGAIRARPVLPVMVSMLIVVFAMFELILLPGLYVAINPGDPIVNGAAMGMTVKTDGADAAAGAILDELQRAWAYTNQGIKYEEGSILASAIMTKIWIDMFIGVWAFVLAIIWVYKVERQPGQSHVGASEIWYRFPKFVLGYFFCWFFYLGIAVFLPDLIKSASVGANIVQSPMRKMMFMLCFVSIGVITDFSKLKGMGKLALLYAIALFLIIAPIAYVVAWIFHHGMMPPLAS
ncbi:MAG: putative sulfate exporter family transporter [Candidatus Nitrospinota bacterium M3_3B_026]